MTSSPAPAGSDPVVEKLDEIARLIALLVKRDRPLAESIEEMGTVGFGQKRISELVGTSPGYVDNIIQKARRQQKKPPTKRTRAKGDK